MFVIVGAIQLVLNIIKYCWILSNCIKYVNALLYLYEYFQRLTIAKYDYMLQNTTTLIT